MSQYLFASFAANYRTGQVFRHLFARGNGKDSSALSAALKEHYSGSQAFLYSTGRAALAAAIKSTVPAGSKVAISGLTCYAVPQAVRAAGCTPVYVDVSATDFNFSGRDLLRTLGKHPDIKAIIIQNMLGLTADIATFEKIAEKRGITIIEDLAHCAGAHYRDGREVGTVGASVALSFGKGKSIDTVRGGAVVIRTDPLESLSTPRDLPKLSVRLKDRFYPLLGLMQRGLYHIHLGKPFTALLMKLHLVDRAADGRVSLSTRLTDWQARLALRELSYLPAVTISRTRTAARIITRLSLPPIPAGSAPLRVPILVHDRDQLLADFRRSHIYFDDIWYDVPVSPRRYFAKTKFPESECPSAVAIADYLINLPTYYSLEQLTPALKIIEESLS